jgi:hypothetical protein
MPYKQVSESLTVINKDQKSSSVSAAAASSDIRRLFVMMLWGATLRVTGGCVVHTTVFGGLLRFLSPVIWIVCLSKMSFIRK